MGNGNNPGVIDLRTDVKTLPTAAMYRAMCEAPLGDDKAGEDPTVKRLEEMAAGMLGMEAAVLMISGAMCNLAALAAHVPPQEAYVADTESHLYFYEGGHAALTGTLPIAFTSRDGVMEPAEIERVIRSSGRRPRLLWLENTHNRGGGRVLPPETGRRLLELAREHDMKVHVDGARIFNAAVAAGVPPSVYGEQADSIMFCLSKSLSCPLGSVLCGSGDFIARAKSFRARLGGGMRQAGIFAAAGIVALEEMIDRLAEDHALAKTLAGEVGKMPGLSVNLETVETNMVNVGFEDSGRSLEEWLGAFREEGVLAGAHRPRAIRLVVHRHHDRATLAEAARRMGVAAGKLAS